MKALLQGYADAIANSRMTGRRVGFRVDVDSEGSTIMTRVEETAQAAEPTARDTELQAALAAARDRGRLRAAEILAGEDMLSADASLRCSARPL